MKTFYITNLNEIKQDENKRIAALGFFDGLHKAHQKIISSAVKKSINKNQLSIVITLDISPKQYFKGEDIVYLTPESKKIELIEKMHVDELYILKFSEEIRSVTKEDFVELVLKKLSVSEIFCGYDYRFGYKGLGDANFISNYTNNNILVNIIDEQKNNNERISTTLLKECIENLKFDKFYYLTGRYYSIKGIVVKGRQLGRTINFPTANLFLEEEYLIPSKNGVYITVTSVEGKKYKSITNIGYNPTVSSQKDKKFIETHILNFDKNIYDQEIEIFFYDFIRSEKKFESFDQLKEQLIIDKKKCEDMNIKY